MPNNLDFAKRAEKNTREMDEFGIVLQRYYDHVYICLFVNIEIKTLRSYIQQSGVVLKTVRYQLG